MGTPPGDSPDPTAAPAPATDDAPIEERIPQILSSGSFRTRRPPRPTLEKPRTTLLLPKTGRGWLKALLAALVVVAVTASTIFGVRYFTATDCETFSVDRTTIASPEGFRISVAADDVVGSFGVRFASTPLNEFLNARSVTMRQTAAALPQALAPRSNYIGIATCATGPERMSIRMPIPADETDLDRLDLYGWSRGQRVWSWLGGAIDRERREIYGDIRQLPDAVILVKTSPTQPILGVELPPATGNDAPSNAVPLSSVVGEVTAAGLYLGDLGGVVGERSRLQTPAASRVVPVLRNWNDKGEVNRRLLRDMLTSRSSRELHIENIVAIAESGNFPGIEIDYRGLDLKQQQLFVDFLAQLAAALQAKARTLSVAIPAPIFVSGKWDSGGYDVATIGQTANYVKLDLSVNPGALTSDQLDSLMHWAVGHVNRYKLQLVLPSQSIRQDAYGATQLLRLEDALAPLGRLEPTQPTVRPSVRVPMRWGGSITDLTFDDASQAYRYSYVNTRGIQQNVWINTPASFKRSLERLGRYNVRGITLRGLDTVTHGDDIAQIFTAFAEGRLTALNLPAPNLAISGAGNAIEVRLDQAIEVQAPAEAGEHALALTFRTSRALPMPAEPLRVAADAPEIAASTTPSTTIPGAVFELGGHTASLTHLAQMQSSGMTWVRFPVVGFALPTELIAEAKAAGLKVLIEAMGNPGQVLDESYQREWTQHLAKLAAAGADAIEVWDEPNHEGSWPTGSISGARYAALLKLAHAAIKAANPNTLVVSAGLVASEAFGGGCSQNGCDDVMFLLQMAAAGAQEHLDCVGAHFITGFSSPSIPVGAARTPQFAAMRDQYFRAFGGARSVCFTELGYVSAEGFSGGMPGNYAWATATTAAQQAQWLAEAAKLSHETGKVRLMIVWNVDSTLWVAGDSGDPQAGYAILRPDGSCPACETLRGVMTSQ
jgi:hypothetical protein